MLCSVKSYVTEKIEYLIGMNSDLVLSFFCKNNRSLIKKKNKSKRVHVLWIIQAIQACALTLKWMIMAWIWSTIIDNKVTQERCYSI